MVKRLNFTPSELTIACTSVKKIMRSVFKIIVLVASALACKTASAQSVCDVNGQPEHNTFIITSRDGTALGTAFPIDSRGLFLTAKHLIYHRDVQELIVKRVDDGTVSFPIAGVIHSGSYNRTDFSKLNLFDDWSIFWVEVDTYDGDVFLFPYDRASDQTFSSLSAHSHQGVSNVTSTIARAPYPSDACSSEAMVVASLSQYRKTSSGAPISDSQCVFGVTSRFDASYRGFVADFSDDLDAITSLNSLSVEIYERLSSGELRENFIEEILSKVDDGNLRSCIESSEIQCMAQHVDQLRDTLSSLEAVVITPMSCVAETIVTEYFDRNNGRLRAALKGLSSTSKVRKLLDAEISSDVDARRYARSIQSRINIVHWSWLSYVELLEKYLLLADTTDINVKPIRTALVNIGNEIAGHSFRESIRDAYRKVRNEEFRRQTAELAEARSAARSEAERQRQIIGGVRSELDSLTQGTDPLLSHLDSVMGSTSEILQRVLFDAERRLELAENTLVELDYNLARISTETEDYRKRANIVDAQLAQLPITRVDGVGFEQRLRIYEANLEAVIDPGASGPNNRFVFPFEGLDIPQDEPFIAKDTRSPFERWLDQEMNARPWVQQEDELKFQPEFMVPNDQLPGRAPPPVTDNLGIPGFGPDSALDGEMPGLPGGFNSVPLR